MGKRRVFGLFVAILVVAVAGCGSGRPSTVPVTGTVTLDGDSVEGASVTFAPEAGGRPATGVTDASGKFTLKTFQSGDGAIPGAYNVSVSKIEEETAQSADPEDENLMGADTADEDVKYLIPQKYFSPKTSGLTIEVKSGMEPVSLNLTSK